MYLKALSNYHHAPFPQVQVETMNRHTATSLYSLPASFTFIHSFYCIKINSKINIKIYTLRIEPQNCGYKAFRSANH